MQRTVMEKVSRFTQLLLTSKLKLPWPNQLAIPAASFHTTCGLLSLKDRLKKREENQKQLIEREGDYFEDLAKRDAQNRRTFERAIELYMRREHARRRGNVEFIYAALKRMKDFGVEKDLETYKKIMDTFPKAKMVPANNIQVEFMHYPKHQQCCIDLLAQMEDNGVTPDDEMGYMVYYTFGKDTHAMRKYQRMMYWMPKFKNINPWPIPRILPKDPTEVAKIALRRMAVDLENKLSVFWSETLEQSIDKTWIVSAQCPAQRALLAKHNPKNPVYVEGGDHVWARNKCLTYFSLRADPTPERKGELKQAVKEEEFKLKGLFEPNNWKMFFEEEDLPKQMMLAPSIHEQEDGTFLAMCITGTASKDSLKSWIAFLQATNPILTDTPVVFKLRTPESGIQSVDSKESSVEMQYAT